MARSPPSPPADETSAWKPSVERYSESIPVRSVSSSTIKIRSDSRCSRTSSCIISGPRIDRQTPVFRDELDGVICAFRAPRWVRGSFCRVAYAVLVVERLFDLRVDRIDGLAFRHFERDATGLPGHACQTALPAFAGSRNNSGSNGKVELHRIGETNGIQDGVRALGKLDRGRDGGVVAEGDAIGQQDKRLA